MEMKAKTNRRAGKIVIAICLVLALLAAMGIASYAWIRNYVAVENINLTTGKMLYKITLYQKDENGNWANTDFFDTGAKGETTDAARVESVDTQIIDDKDTINITPGEQVFFVIEKYPNSVDLDATVSFEKDGDKNYYTYMGQTNFKIKESSDEFKSKIKELSDELNESTETSDEPNESTETSDEPNVTEDTVPVADVVSALASTSIGNDDDFNSMNGIWDTVQKMKSLEGNSSDYACVRMAFSQIPEKQSNDVTDESFPLNVKFCVTQKGAPLPGEPAGRRWDVSTETDFKKFLANYDFGDELYLTNNVEYEGDVVLTRPCKITLLRSTLTIKGNLIFTYGYEGEFALNTVSDGHVKVLKNNDAAGNFQIALPNSKIDLEGANNAAEEMADVYVEGGFTVNASKADDKGAYFKGLRVCEVGRDENSEPVFEQSLKSLVIDGTLGLYTTNRTNLGKISATNYGEGYGFTVSIDNRGTIEQIDLTNMIQDKTFKKSPCILIDNAGTLTDDTIRLPSWSQKFSCDTKGTENTTDDTFLGNTRIIANKGSGTMKAITANFIDWPKDSSELTEQFISNREKLEDYNDRDDIEYAVRKVFVDVIEKDIKGNPINVVIHYEQPSDVAMASDSTLSTLGALSTYPALYEYDHAKFKTVKIICYGAKALSVADYEFIRDMTALVELDLSEAMSESKTVTFYDGDLKANVTETHKTVPEGAFEGMSNLSSVIMSESDTAWDKNIFKDTKVDEITFPQALTRLWNTRYDSSSGSIRHGKVSAQDVLTGIKYVYTSITKVEGIWADSKATQYFFVPDEYTYGVYRSLNIYDDTVWHSKIFINNGVVRFGTNGEMFLRYDPKAEQDERFCEFVVQTDGSVAWTENAKSSYGFDFDNITINGNIYKIVSYDPYALYDKLDNEINLSITFGDKLETIGRYAFATNESIASVKFGDNADTKLMGYTFYQNEALVSVYAPSVTTLDGGYNFAQNSVLKTFSMPKLNTVNDSGDLRECKALERVDISVIEYTNANKNFYSAPNSSTYDEYSYAKFYIHTENAPLRETITYNVALGADYRYIFVNTNYVDLYTVTSTYTGVADIGNNGLDAIKEATVEDVAYYYYVDGTDACLVACLASSIDKSADEAYTLVASFTEGGTTYPITKIGSAAYHFTEMKARVLNVPNTVEEIGQYAFDARKATFKKYFITLNLANVEKAGSGALYYVDMVRLIGDSLVEVGADTLSNNASLIVANLPNLSRSQPAGEKTTPPKVFIGASSLRIAYTSYSDNIRYDSEASRTKACIRFINYPVAATNEFIVSNVNTVVAGVIAEPEFDYNKNVYDASCNYVNTDSDFADIYYSDFYDCKFNFNGNEESISLPGYFYYLEDNGELTLIAVSPDVTDFGEWDGSNYTTPSSLYIGTDRRYTSIENGTTPEFDITRIGQYAYAFAKFSMGGDFIIGENVRVIDKCALRNCAYSTSGTLVVLDKINCLNLVNVVSLGDYACYSGHMITLKAPLLKQIGMAAFRSADKLKTVNLPSFEETTGTAAFWFCSALEDITVGVNAKTFSSNTFLNAKSLKTITILNKTDVVNTDASITQIGSSITVTVYKGLLSQYQTKYPSGFGGIPITNFTTFGEAYTDGDIVYCWNKLDETAKTAYIESISGALTEDITIPSTIDGYTIVAVSPSAMSSLNGVKTLTLPSGMAHLTFTGAALADSIETLVIDDENKSFMTVDGVLYSQNGTVLYVYPKAKAAESFEVSNTVTQIFDEAFCGVDKLETLTVKGVVTIGDRAFAEATILNSITFESYTPSTFAGRDILSGANVNLKIYVPSGTLAAYKAKVLVDYSILDRIEEL